MTQREIATRKELYETQCAHNKTIERLNRANATIDEINRIATNHRPQHPELLTIKDTIDKYHRETRYHNT